MFIKNEDFDNLIDNKLKSFVNCCKENKINIYLVGGVVRDLLLHRPITDIDVDIVGDTTIKTLISILPDDVIVIEANQFFGTCKLKVNDIVFDYATMRIERYTAKSRYPKVVSWTNNLKKDSSRRDFTINAIYINIATREIIDYEDGLNDLKHGIIKCIGNPYSKITEDITRIFRGIRFTKKYNFALDPLTASAMIFSMPAIMRLSQGLIQEEMEKILLY